MQIKIFMDIINRNKIRFIVEILRYAYTLHRIIFRVFFRTCAFYRISFYGEKIKRGIFVDIKLSLIENRDLQNFHKIHQY